MKPIFDQVAIALMLAGLAWIVQGLAFSRSYPDSDNLVVLITGVLMAGLGAGGLLAIDGWFYAIPRRVGSTRG